MEREFLPGTTVALQSSGSASVGQQVTFTAAVAPVSLGAGLPGGTVTFKDGATVLGTVSLSNGAASLKTAKLSKGKHTLTAVYDGDDNLVRSTSAALSVMVN